MSNFDLFSLLSQSGGAYARAGLGGIPQVGAGAYASAFAGAGLGNSNFSLLGQGGGGLESFLGLGGIPQVGAGAYSSAFAGYPSLQQPAEEEDDGGMMSMLMMIMSLMSGGLGGLGGGSSAPVSKPRNDFVDTTTTDVTAQVWGDPHFVGFEGDHYDVMGQNGKTYNILSDSNVQYNTKFKTYQNDPNVTVIGEAGLKVGTAATGEHQIQFSPEGGAKFDGKEMKKGETKSFDTGLNDKDGRPVRGKATFDGTNLTVNTGEYELTLENKGGYLDQKVKVTNLGVLSDGVKAHGLLGQTADFDGKVRTGKQGAGAQGEGAIDGVYTDYEVKSLFDNKFKYNKFGKDQEVQAKIGVGAGKKGAAN